VVDASALLEYLLRTEASTRVQPVIEDPAVDLHVPALCDVEVTAGLRRGLISDLLVEMRAAEALTDYLDLPLHRHGHQSLLARALQLRANFSAYDAAYVTLAEQLGAFLLTQDHALSRSVKAHTSVVVLA